MIAGRHPCGGGSVEEIVAALKSDDEITPLDEASGPIPAALIQIVAKALKKDRDQRYASAGEMLADLNRLKSLIKVGGGEQETQSLRAQTADQLLTRFVVFHEANGKTLIPLGLMWTIWRFAGLRRGRLERELIRKSLVGGLARNGWRVLLIAIVTLAAAAWLSVAETWDEQMMRDGHAAAVRRAVFSPDGRLLVTVGEDKQVIVWDFARRQRLANFKDHADRVTTVEFSPDGKWFVTAGADGSIIVWDANRLAKTAVLPGQRGVVRAIAFSADSKMLATPTNDDLKNIWEVGSWKKLREVNTPHYRYGQYLLSRDGRWMMTPHGDVCDLLTTRCVVDLRPLFWSGITPYAKNLRPPFWSWAALSPDGRRMISIDAGGFVAFSEPVRFERPDERELTGHYRMHGDSGRAIAYSPDGKLAASGAEDIVLWDAMEQKKLARFKHQANVSSLAFSPDGQWLVSTHADGAILAWDTVERELRADFTEHSAAVEAVAFAPGGKLIASAGADGSIIVWDAQQGSKQAVLLWHVVKVTAVSFSADGKWLVSNDLDGNLAMWDVAARRLRWSQQVTKRIPSEASYCAAISPDGRWLATSYGVYESDGGKLASDFRTETVPYSAVALPQPTEVRDVAFSADGQWLFSVTARGEIAVRQFGQWQVVESHRLNGAHLVSLSLSPDGRQMVTGEDEGLVRLWQTRPLRQTAAMAGHSGHIKSVAFSPDGQEIVSASDDKTIALWDVGRHKLVTRIGLHTAPVYAVAFSPDGKRLISGGHDHSVRLYTRRRSLWGWRLE